MSMLKSVMSNSFSKRKQLASAPFIIDGEPKYKISQIVDLSGAVHTMVEVHRIDSEMSGIVE